jgi:hypothetical protein
MRRQANSANANHAKEDVVANAQVFAAKTLRERAAEATSRRARSLASLGVANVGAIRKTLLAMTRAGCLPRHAPAWRDVARRSTRPPTHEFDSRNGNRIFLGRCVHYFVLHDANHRARSAPTNANQ